MEDLRVIKTKSSIKGAFIELVEEKGFDNVTVKDICSKALINRNTFYLHYYDKVDLLNKIASEVFSEQENTINFMSSTIDNQNIDSLKEGLLQILKVLHKEIEFYRVILLDSNMSGYIDRFALDLKERYMTHLGVDYKKNRIELDYVFYGIVGVIKNWIIKDYESIDSLANRLSNIIYNNLITFVK